MPAPEHTGVNSGCPSGGQSLGGDGGSAGHVAAEIRGTEAGVWGAEMCAHTSEATRMGRGPRKAAGGRDLISVIKDELSRGT